MSSSERERRVEDHSFRNEFESSAAEVTLPLSALHPVNLTVSAELGKCPMTVRDILDLSKDTVLVLNKQAGEMAELLINGIPFARGEIVVLGDTLHVRIAEIFGINTEES